MSGASEAPGLLDRVRRALGERGLRIVEHDVLDDARVIVLAVPDGRPPPRKAVAPGTRAASLRIGERVVDLDRRAVMGPEGTIPLAPREADLLRLLARHRGRTLPRRELMARLWGPGVSAGALDTAVHRLRKKVESEPSRPRWIVAVRGRGFRLEPEPGGAVWSDTTAESS